MTWNYRIVSKDESFAIHEAFYDDDGKVETITQDPCSPSGETISELKEDLKYFEKSLSLPILNYTDF
ncbi:hypothetical protein [Candidatus Thioglobus sp.]|uniref:hypothetical protein n=1 Tax=Candidatus Thioglobus sp. TaxID=2026721 RepID=UPI003D14F201